MSWIRNHLRHYVIPGLKALSRGEACSDIVRTPINMRPARAFNKEMGLILAAAKCLNIPLSAQNHAILLTGNPTLILGSRSYGLPEPQKTIHNVVKNSCKSLRRLVRKGKILILPGRDVWLWSVQCHKMGVPHIFDPRISRLVASQTNQLREITDTWKLTDDHIIFDTGFAGSIYKRIVGVSGVGCHNLMLSTMRKNLTTNLPEQLWPYHKNSRGKALLIEYLPKYQTTGTVRDGVVVQNLSNIEEFLRAAILTVWFWHYKSPAWIDQGAKGRCRVVDCSCRSCKLWKEGVMSP